MESKRVVLVLAVAMALVACDVQAESAADPGEGARAESATQLAPAAEPPAPAAAQRGADAGRNGNGKKGKKPKRDALYYVEKELRKSGIDAHNMSDADLFKIIDVKPSDGR